MLPQIFEGAKRSLKDLRPKKKGFLIFPVLTGYLRLAHRLLGLPVGRFTGRYGQLLPKPCDGTMKKSRLTYRLMTWWIALAIGLGFWSASPEGEVGARVEAAAGDGLEEEKARFARIQETIGALVVERDKLEKRYTRLTREITSRKKSGNAELLQDLKLQNLLKEAKVLSEQLYALQSQIRGQERFLDKARKKLLTSYDARIADQEEIMFGGIGAERTQAITEINALRRARHAYTVPAPVSSELLLEALPSFEEEAIQDPEEARAAADELDDADRKLQHRIQALETQIADLEAQKRLRRKAQSFRAEQSFFDDARPGARRVARSNGDSRTSPTTGANGRDGVNTEDSASEGGDQGGDSPSNNTPDADPTAPGEDNNSAGNNGGAPDDGGNNNSVGNNSSGSNDNNFAPEEPAPGDNNETNNDPGGQDSEEFDANNGAEVIVVEPGSSLPPFLGYPGDGAGSAETIVVEGDPETLGITGSREQNTGGSLEARLRRVKKEKKALQSKSLELQRRSDALKRMADDL